MKRFTLLSLALGLVLLAPAAPDLRAEAEPKADPVIVDPADLRPPIPDPREGVMKKYNNKLVRFSGVVHNSTLNKETNEHQANLHFDIVHHLKVKGKDTVVETETIAVRVTFLKEEKALHQLFEKEKKAKKPSPQQVTVQGKGSVMTNGTLVITEAVIVP